MDGEPQPRELPIVEYEGTRWYFDERLRQIRNVSNPHDYQNLNDFEMVYFRDRVKGQRDIRI